jgi:hypothetical protein
MQSDENLFLICFQNNACMKSGWCEIGKHFSVSNYKVFHCEDYQKKR